MGAPPPEWRGDSEPAAKKMRLHEPPAAGRLQGQFPFEDMPGFQLQKGSEPFPTRPGVIEASGLRSCSISEPAAAMPAVREFLFEQAKGLAGHTMQKEQDRKVTLNAALAVLAGLGSTEGISFSQPTVAEEAMQPSPSKAEPAGAQQQAAGAAGQAAGSPTTGDRSSADSLRHKREQEYKIRGMQRFADAVGELRDVKNGNRRYFNILYEIKNRLASATPAVYQGAIVQSAEQVALTLAQNACDTASPRSVKFVATDFDLLVIGSAKLSDACIKHLHQEHYGHAERVVLEELEGSFKLVYATGNASIQEPTEDCACVEAVLELFAATLPQCKHWTSTQWAQRHLGGHRGKLRRAHRTLDVLDQLPEGCDWQRISGLLDRGQIPEAYQALQCTVQPPEAATGAIAAKRISGLDADVAQLIDEELQGYSTGIVDAAKAALQQAGARTLEDVPYVKEAFLEPLGPHLTPVALVKFIDQLKAHAKDRHKAGHRSSSG